ncbi:uncharacterized protein LOC125012437 [Mugil cephalus]|uniref:uncharacterized protein LOC125012437 n=1 Tax=Mugil cephalus TaxID=48193 RepID=UPI001FB64A64|nr:uncharacterized protein LOC125012437 [Mugil cephalus]
MVNLTLTPVLLCTFSWISVSVSEFYTVEVQPGEEVTLLCSNFSSIPTNIFWFKLVNGPYITRISAMLSSDQNAFFYDGFDTGKFNMTSNTTTLFLKIKPVDLTDSGLYFCGSNQGQYSVTVSVAVIATNLRVQEVLSDGFTNVMTVILAGTMVFPLMVICLVVKIQTCHTGENEEVIPQHTENTASSLNDVDEGLHSSAIRRRRRPASERLVESYVIYATRG